ncbi:MAG: hypothetical protein NT040_02925 [Bacteroidetes bacterium]|nr:hypothetical protein [Bacteroidota bacterium]
MGILMKLKSTGLTLMFALFITLAFSQDYIRTDSVSVQTKQKEITRRHFLGSSLFILLNLAPDPGDYYQLDYGYFLTRKDAILVEATTWKYHAPVGIPYGSSVESYPGYVRAYGIGLGYQRFWWKNLFTTVEATSFLQQFYDNDNKKIQKGFQLYLQVVLGYRFEFFKKRWYVEPAIALKYWPVNTNFPASFAAIESGINNYKIEPSLNFGIRF